MSTGPFGVGRPSILVAYLVDLEAIKVFNCRIFWLFVCPCRPLLLSLRLTAPKESTPTHHLQIGGYHSRVAGTCSRILNAMAACRHPSGLVVATEGSLRMCVWMCCDGVRTLRLRKPLKKTVVLLLQGWRQSQQMSFLAWLAIDRG